MEGSGFYNVLTCDMFLFGEMMWQLVEEYIDSECKKAPTQDEKNSLFAKLNKSTRMGNPWIYVSEGYKG